MARFFNTAGVCRPADHYMVAPEKRLSELRLMIARAFELTGGQPWLVNALARQLVEKLVPDRGQAIELADVEVAKEILIRRRDTHLDSLVDRLREDRVRKVLVPILTGLPPDDDVCGSDLQFVKDLGLISFGPDGLVFTNPIYHEIVNEQTWLPPQREHDGRLSASTMGVGSSSSSIDAKSASGDDPRNPQTTP